MALIKREYTDEETLITAQNLNDIQDAVIDLEYSLFTVDNVKSGEVISITDATKRGFRGLSIYGKTTQAGTPTPDAPVDLVNIGNRGSITVDVTSDNEPQSMTVETPNGLPGIPVSSGGNYTDSNGQQWICDEIDFARGVYVQRVIKRIFDGSENWRLAERDETIGSVGVFYVPMYEEQIVAAAALCSRYQMARRNASSSSTAGEFDTNYSQFRVNATDYVTTLEDWRRLLNEWHTQGTPLYGEFAISQPIETPIPEEEIAAYKALYTDRGNNTVSNDAGAWMEVEYVMDAKKYIDSLVTTPPARLSTVTLSASKWAGSNSLYSQVVTIPGITENSKVDLLPSVEQLAIFFNKNVAFITENEDGVVTVYAIGDKPTNDYTMQVQITEVEA